MGYACNSLNMTAEVGETPDKLSPYRKVHGRARQIWFLNLGYHHIKRALKSETKAQACFYLSGGSHHQPICFKMLFPSRRRSYTPDAT